MKLTREFEHVVKEAAERRDLNSDALPLRLNLAVAGAVGSGKVAMVREYLATLAREGFIDGAKVAELPYPQPVRSTSALPGSGAIDFIEAFEKSKGGAILIDGIEGAETGGKPNPALDRLISNALTARDRVVVLVGSEQGLARFTEDPSVNTYLRSLISLTSDNPLGLRQEIQVKKPLTFAKPKGSPA